MLPKGFSKATHDVLTEFLPEVTASKGPPRAISQENFTADILNVWGNQFILGHELGHALIHQLNLPLTGMEEEKHSSDESNAPTPQSHGLRT